MAMLEVCVDDVAGLDAAIKGGADRIELCAALSVGGLTPSVGLMEKAASCGVPCHAMIRPRSGDFNFSAGEVNVILSDIMAARKVGLTGVVLGALTEAGDLDRPALSRMVAAAGPIALTLHRAIDVTSDPVGAIGTAVDLGFHTVLTSGGARTALEGVETLARMQQAAAGRTAIMAGSGVTSDAIPRLAATGVQMFHASCRVPAPASGKIAAMGLAPSDAARTDAAKVAALKAVVWAL